TGATGTTSPRRRGRRRASSGASASTTPWRKRSARRRWRRNRTLRRQRRHDRIEARLRLLAGIGSARHPPAAGASRLGLTPRQQIERSDVRYHQHRHVDDRDRVCGAQLTRQRRKAELVAMIIIDDEVGCPDEIEGDDERPKERRFPHREKRQDRQHPGCEVAIGGERGEAGGQIGADDAWHEEDESEEAEAVQRRNGALCLDLVDRFEPGPEVSAEAKQPWDIPEDEMDLEDGRRRHFWPPFTSPLTGLRIPRSWPDCAASAGAATARVRGSRFAPRKRESAHPDKRRRRCLA